MRAVPPPRAQRNFTDPDWRTMKTGDGSFQHGDNAQTMVNDNQRMTLATKATQCAGDVGQSLPVIGQTIAAPAAAGHLAALLHPALLA